jgi:hypothetical protein
MTQGTVKWFNDSKDVLSTGQNLHCRPLPEQKPLLGLIEMRRAHRS